MEFDFGVHEPNCSMYVISLLWVFSQYDKSQYQCTSFITRPDVLTHFF